MLVSDSIQYNRQKPNCLDQLLQSVQMEGVLYTNAVLSAPWGICHREQHNTLVFHLVVEGSAQLVTEQHQMTINCGDFVMFPHGSEHRISDKSFSCTADWQQLEKTHLTPRYALLEHGGGGDTCKMISGSVSFEHPMAARVLKTLPSFIYLAEHSYHQLEAVLALLRSEVQSVQIGSEALTTKLADVLVLKVLSHYLQLQPSAQLGWFGAAQDQRISKAVQQLQQYPERKWTLSSLAMSVGMSRANFAKLFKQLVGDTPMEYLSELRMSRAFDRLKHSNDSLLSIALDLGYQSESAFSRAFKSVIKQTPKEVRKMAKNTEHRAN